MQKFLFLFILLFPSLARADVAVTHNIHYGQNAAQIVDVYRPDACRDTFCPVVLWVHGGGWKHGDMQGRAATQMMTAWAARGIVMVGVNYRLSPAVKHPAHVEDVASAISWAHDNIADYGGDASRLLQGVGREVRDQFGEPLIVIADRTAVDLVHVTERDPAARPGIKDEQVRSKGPGRRNSRIGNDRLLVVLLRDDGGHGVLVLLDVLPRQPEHVVEIDLGRSLSAECRGARGNGEHGTHPERGDRVLTHGSSFPARQ